MRRLLLVFLLVSSFARSIVAQDFVWCGYALIEGLPLLDNQLAVLAAITPAKSVSAQPDELFQYRYNLKHSAVLIEGCWTAQPSYDLISSLLAQTIKVDQATIDSLIKQRLISPEDAKDPAKVALVYIKMNMTYTLFAPDGTHEEGAKAVRAYLQDHSDEWEAPLK